MSKTFIIPSACRMKPSELFPGSKYFRMILAFFIWLGAAIHTIAHVGIHIDRIRMNNYNGSLNLFATSHPCRLAWKQKRLNACTASNRVGFEDDWRMPSGKQVHKLWNQVLVIWVCTVPPEIMKILELFSKTSARVKPRNSNSSKSCKRSCEGKMWVPFHIVY